MRKDYHPLRLGRRICVNRFFSPRLRCALIAAMIGSASKGSQKWLQIAVNETPEVLINALRRSGAAGPEVSLTWHSPLKAEGFLEYRDQAALTKTRISKLKRPLDQFWPNRGPVWDALGITSEGHPLFIEAKAHIPEAATSSTKASSAESRALIHQSLTEARRFYAPRATVDWSDFFYQYANRLAHQYFFRQVNGVPSILVFLYFVNATDMSGPTSEQEWHGAVRLIHAVLGLPPDLRSHGIFDAFVDVKLLNDSLHAEP